MTIYCTSKCTRTSIPRLPRVHSLDLLSSPSTSLTHPIGQRLSLACGPALEPGPADALSLSPLDSESGSLRANGRAQNAFSLAKGTLLVDWLQNCANSFPDNTLYSLVNSKVIARTWPTQ